MIGLVRQMFRYGLKGGVMTLLNIAGMMLLVEIVDIKPAYAAIVSTVALILIGYQLMNRFVFPNATEPRSQTRRLASYYLVILTGKGLNYLIFTGLVSIGLWYPLSWFFGAVIVFLGTFSANRYVWGSSHAA